MKRLFILLFSTISLLRAQSPIIPMPVDYQAGSGYFALKPGSAVGISSNIEDLKKLADHLISSPIVKSLRLQAKNRSTNVINLEILKSPSADLGDEGYSLTIKSKIIQIAANKPAGIFYGIQSLLQMVPLESDRGIYKIPCAMIKDHPRFGWRGLMLDVSRHFFTVDEVKQYIDAMALYKLNTLHLHLTDDNGWRIEIKSLPKLTSVGAWRVERAGTFGDRESPKEGEATPYGGFYTHEQVRELVRYAADHQITIVPEIDVPGHSMAMLAAYHELSCTHEKVYVNPGTNFAEWYGNGTFKMLIDNTLNPANELVYEYLDKVFTEVAMLFPNPYIHIGGDECYHGYWEENADVKALMAKENFTDIHQVQSYFIKRLEKIVASKNKKLLGWDEILEGGLAPGASVMSWRGMKGGIEAAQQGHEVVMTPQAYTYIDYMQGDRSLEFWIYASLTLQKVYSLEPVPDDIDPKYILGAQANLWSEKVPTIRHAFYMTYPRAFALAETAWSPKSLKNWDSFIQRTEHHFKLFDQLQWNVSRSLHDATATVKKQGDDIICTLSTEMPGTDIYYSMDNTFPDQYSTKYTSPFKVPMGDVTLRFVTVKDGKILGRLAAIPRADLVSRAK